MGLADDYCGAVHDQLKTFADPDLSDPWQLGDYGIWDGNVLKYAGTLKDLADMPAIRPRSGSSARPLFVSSSLESVSFDAQTSFAWPPNTTNTQVAASAGVQLGFTKRNQFWVNLGDQTTDIIENLDEIMHELVRRAGLKTDDPKWWNHGRFRVLTKITKAQRVAAVMSMSDHASLSIEATGKLKAASVDWGDAKLDLGWTRESGAVHKWPTMNATPGKEYVPFFNLCHVFIEPFNRGWQATGGCGQ